MSGALDFGPGVLSIGFESQDPTILDRAHSGRTHSRKMTGQRWAVTLRWPRLKRAEIGPVWASLIAQQGRHGVITAVLPQISTPSGVATGTPVTGFASRAAGSTFVFITGLTPSITGVLHAMDVIKFAGHSKVYQVTVNADADVGGLAIISIYPPLIADVALGEAVTIRDVPFMMRREKDNMRIKIERGLYTLDMPLVENI